MMLRSQPPIQRHRGFTRGPLTVLRALWCAYLAMQFRRALRLVLDSLDDRTLKDIGVARGEIDAIIEGTHSTSWARFDPPSRCP